MNNDKEPSFSNYHTHTTRCCCEPRVERCRYRRHVAPLLLEFLYYRCYRCWRRRQLTRKEVQVRDREAAMLRAATSLQATEPQGRNAREPMPTDTAVHAYNRCCTSR